MKKILVTVFSFWLVFAASSQSGKVVLFRIASDMLRNKGGENPVRRVTVYLPPGYDTSHARYPVIYFLHGFAWNDSLLVASDHWDLLLDKAIQSGKIRPVIMVMPNEETLYGGSFYTNSSLTGRWADFTGIELVNEIDKRFRTIPRRESRGVAGHSMGGHGAIRMGMRFPSVFSSVYALSPAVLSFEEELALDAAAFKNVSNYRSPGELLKSSDFMSRLIVSLGRAYAPNLAKPPFGFDLPSAKSKSRGDSAVVNEWTAHTPLSMVMTYADSLRKLTAFKMDWGRNDEFRHIPSTCLKFSQALEKAGVRHFAEAYIGTHGSEIMTDGGRALNDLLPFFNTYLRFAP